MEATLQAARPIRGPHGGWQKQEIDALQQSVEAAERSGESLRSVFERMSRQLGRKPNSIRNFYYAQVRAAQGEDGARATPFETFSPEEVERLVEQVAVNLVKNAREAAEGLSDGRIEVVARISADETVRIDFGDNGAAIPAEVSDNIFTPFFTTKPDGSGIGLSVSRRIMQLHGGSLRLTSNVDGKVTFTLFFA